MGIEKDRVGQAANVRFVVGSLATMEQAVSAVKDLRRHDLPADAIAVLAKQELLSRESEKVAALDADDRSHVEFDLLESHKGKVRCYGRTLGDLLKSRVNRGSKTLKDALQYWLLPRHARSLSDIVEKDGILIWVEISNAAEERVANLSLLRTSRGTVEVHDFIAEC